MTSISLKEAMILVMMLFTAFSIFLFVQHEIVVMQRKIAGTESDHGKPNLLRSDPSKRIELPRLKPKPAGAKGGLGGGLMVEDTTHQITEKPAVNTPPEKLKPIASKSSPDRTTTLLPGKAFHGTNSSNAEQRGTLMCDGKSVDSEVIYWKIVPGDNSYESPITPHHDEHHDKYLTFEYDQGGWNNLRMGMECLIVVAHATGRTLVVPPQQHLYLLGRTFKDAHDKEAHDEMGFEDFFDLDLLRSHQGFHILHMEEFLAKEGVTGGLNGKLPPDNSSLAWGRKLWDYMIDAADEKPSWMGRFIAFPDSVGDFNLSKVRSSGNTKALSRLKEFGGDRSPVYYDDKLQEAHHIHFQAGPNYRLLQHHYAFAFFTDPAMQSFYRRFVRDYMRYKDVIQCAGAELVKLIRADALKINPQGGGEFYALHIRRGDFQFKDVKHSAEEIVKNLHFPNGTAIIPPGHLVYLSTDDPDGVCKDCLFNRKPCGSYKTPKPVGCPEDTTWNAMRKAGWKLKFMKDYLNDGHLRHVNPNTHGMVESIVCSRAKVFAGTYFSTFTGYIHRLRGYHGLGEDTYYHSARYLMHPQMKKSIGHGFSREWRAGWTDDGGDLI